ncbi:thioredoxin family protein [bacterium]
MEIKILGTGCPKCKALAEKVTALATENQIEINLEKVTDINQILEYGIMMTPGLVINGEVKFAGKIPSDQKILEWLSGK